MCESVELTRPEDNDYPISMYESVELTRPEANDYTIRGECVQLTRPEDNDYPISPIRRSEWIVMTFHTELKAINVCMLLHYLCTCTTISNNTCRYNHLDDDNPSIYIYNYKRHYQHDQCSYLLASKWCMDKWQVTFR